MDIDSPSELLIDQIRDLYSVESQVLLTMPELAASATNEALRTFLADQEKAARKKGQRLEQAASLLGESPEGDTCKAMQGLIDGGNKHIEKATEDRTRNLIIIAHVNRIFHYRIAGYGFASALADHLGSDGVKDFLARSLNEETAAASALADIALEILRHVGGRSKGEK